MFGSPEPLREASERAFAKLLNNVFKNSGFVTHDVFDYTKYPEQTYIEIHYDSPCRKLKIMNLISAENILVTFNITVNGITRRMGLNASASNQKDTWEYYAGEEGFTDFTIDGGDYPPYFYAEVYK
jgi:hypothetical protein